MLRKPQCVVEEAKEMSISLHDFRQRGKDYHLTWQTRPKIVTENPNMGALDVMKEVGKKWQGMAEEERLYFQKKADRDKIRYVKEQTAFFGEIEKIGELNPNLQNEQGLKDTAEKIAAEDNQK